MEPFEIACPHCSGKLRVATPSLLGRTVKCPKCTNPFTVPSEEDLAGSEEDHGVIEQNVEVGSGVGSSVGVGGGVGVGSGVGIGSGVGASLGRLGHTYDDYAQAGQAAEEAADIDPPSSESNAPAPKSRGEKSFPKGPSTSKGGRRQQPFPAQNLAMILGIPAALLIFGSFFILLSKGYLTGGPKDHRQDGSRFQDFARDAEKNAKWVPQPDNRYRPGRWGED